MTTFMAFPTFHNHHIQH